MTSIEPVAAISPAARAARAAGCAFVSVAGWMSIAYVVIQARGCQGGMECLGDALGIILLGLIGAALTMWPLLRLVRVRPAWLVALGGPFVFVFAAMVLRNAMTAHPALWLIVIMAAYALTAWFADERVSARARWLGVAVLFALVLLRTAWGAVLA